MQKWVDIFVSFSEEYDNIWPFKMQERVYNDNNHWAYSYVSKVFSQPLVLQTETPTTTKTTFHILLAMNVGIVVKYCSQWKSNFSHIN